MVKWVRMDWGRITKLDKVSIILGYRISFSSGIGTRICRLDTNIRNIWGKKGVWITFQRGRNRDEIERTGTRIYG
jgi:hypothetical protein